MAAQRRLFLFHWNDDEIASLAAPLWAAGWEVATESGDGARGGRAIQQNPPAAIVVYLTRLPSHGRETAHALKSMKATRDLPIVFVGGTKEAVARAKAKAPDATYVAPEELLDVLGNLVRA